MGLFLASVFDVAKFILQQKGSMSAWKLQKLCYYSQAWAIAWTEFPLFDDDFEAWSNGPVCRSLFNEHKGIFSVHFNDLKKGNPENLSPDEKDTISVVLRDYGNFSPYQLRELSHSEAPYIDARKGLQDGAPCDNIISKSSMGAFYGSL